MASKSENPDSVYPVLEKWLDDVFKNQDKVLLSARSYIDSVADRDTLFEVVHYQSEVKKCSGLTRSKMSGGLIHNILMANLKREEAEKPEQVALSLAYQKQKIVMR